MLNIIYHVTMLKSYSKKKYRLVLSLSLRRRLWLRLPYPLRLRIEHKCYVSNLIISNLPKLEMSLLQRLKLPVYRKLSRLYPEIVRLSNPYVPSINAPISKATLEDVRRAENIQNFLNRCNMQRNHFINS